MAVTALTGETGTAEGMVLVLDDYHLIDNVVHMQIYVSTFRLENYPVREEDILHTGVEAFAAALNTVTAMPAIQNSVWGALFVCLSM